VLPQAVSEHYRAQQRLIVATLGLVRREWSRMGDDFDATWREVGPRVSLLTASAQLGAARNGAAYVPATLGEIGAAADAEARVNLRAFAGVASDGRPLESLLYGAVVRARTAPAESLAERLKVGGTWLDMAVHTQVADAGRGAASVAIAATPRTGYVRMVNPPCCARCAVLAGKTFLFNQGFLRHPRCDCIHAPIPLAGKVSQFTDWSERPSLDQITGLSKGDRKALSDGADFNRVVNLKERREGMRPKSQRTRATKLTPDDIYRLAKDREDTLRLLKRNGYLL
jgi:hypothetical protein